MPTAIELLAEFNQIGLFNHLSTSEYRILQERFASLNVNSFTTLSPSEQIALQNSFDLSKNLPIWMLREVRDVIICSKDWRKSVYQLDDYEAFLTKLQAISHNQFDISNLKAEFVELDEASKAMMAKHIANTALEISFRFKGRRYGDFLTFYEGKVGGALYDYRLIRIANTALLEADIEGRFYNVYNSSISYIFLSYNQFKELTRKHLLKLYVDQPYTWSFTRVLDVIDTLQTLQLLAYLETDQITSIQKDLLQKKPQSCHSILYAFPNLVLDIDPEMIYDVPEDYTELILETSKISRGVFNPKNIQVTDADIDNPEFTISFEYNNRLYSKTMEYTGDYLDWDYLVLINEALADSGYAERFCLIQATGEMIIFLNETQFKQIQENNLLPLAEHQPW